MSERALRSRAALALFLLIVPSGAWACLWDTDTLEHEANGLPDAVQIITGRFERNPALYYEMRLHRVVQELARNPTLLQNYDDAGVACDRLHRDDEALNWMARKKAQLQRMGDNHGVHISTLPPRHNASSHNASSHNASRQLLNTHWYRYYANVGTFRVHRWLLAGAQTAHSRELAQARSDIAHALALNLHAHFGRERIQLGVMDWMLHNAKNTGEKKKRRKGEEEPKDYKPEHPTPNIEHPASMLSEYLHADEAAEEKNQSRNEAIAKGLTGLIALGNAWESVDVFAALGKALGRKETLHYLANRRAQELIAQGHYSLVPSLPHNSDLIRELSLDRVRINNSATLKLLDMQYRHLRADAEHWQQQRAAYMLSRLRAGRYPDTDPTFWNEYHEPPLPSLTPTWRETLSIHLHDPYWLMPKLLDGGVITLAAIALWAALAWQRRLRHKIHK